MRKNALFIIIVGLFLFILIPFSGTKVLVFAESFGIYEDWSNPTIRSDRWLGRNSDALEVRREVKSKNLLMRFRREGSTISNSGFVYATNRLFTRNASEINQIAADFNVVSLTVIGCPENSGSTRVRPAVIDLNKFNDGTSTGPEDMTGDHFVRVMVNREADSSNPEGVLTAQAFIFRCLDPSCINATGNPYNLDMGTVRVGKKFRLAVLWDEPNDRFIVWFNQDEFVLEYGQELNVLPARRPFSSVRMELVVGNCFEDQTVVDAMTEVGNIYTNESAIIP